MPWSDLYSVGVMAWEHVVGHTPFHDTEAPMAILMRHVNEPIPPVVDVAPDANPEMSEWIERLLVKDAAQRTQSPTEAWEELEEIVISQLGPRWRRDARLPSYTEVLDTPKPLTPAPFESTRTPTPTPQQGRSRLVGIPHVRKGSRGSGCCRNAHAGRAANAGGPAGHRRSHLRHVRWFAASPRQ